MLNLHEVAQRDPWWASFDELARQPLADWQAAFRNDFTARNRARGATRLIRDLEWARQMLTGVRFQSNERFGIRITQEELYLLRSEMSPHEFMSNFGPEGARLQYRGVPLFVDYDPLRIRYRE